MWVDMLFVLGAADDTSQGSKRINMALTPEAGPYDEYLRVTKFDFVFQSSNATCCELEIVKPGSIRDKGYSYTNLRFIYERMSGEIKIPVYVGVQDTPCYKEIDDDSLVNTINWLSSTEFWPHKPASSRQKTAAFIGRSVIPAINSSSRFFGFNVWSKNRES